MRSMTGYGAGRADAPSARVNVEIRSVNQRFLDVKIAAPRDYAAWEREIRDRVRAVAQRGRVEVTVARVPIAARRRYAVAVRTELARAYVEAARRLARGLGLGGEVGLTDVLRLPDLFEVSEQPPDLRRELAAVRKALARALAAFDAERRREGAHLLRDMEKRTRAVRRATADIRRRLPHALAELRRQVEERLVRLVGGAELDRGRVAQEVAVLADRSDVTEELVRLEGHLAALAATLRERGPLGKRIEFLLQEIHRELNTTGSKAGERGITDLVLAAKAEVERLREQVQNVE
ncbi:MAG TPA: YicC/YloC family endoribonuclease [Candidatus Binatia bacterium]|nr:YicC/YloC family endoribonuclease [Candidatus Binatia bacterium]